MKKRNETVLFFELKYGLCSVEDVIAWADEKIELEDNPSIEVIELSVAEPKSKDHLLSLLNPMLPTSDQFELIKIYVPYLLEDIYTKKIKVRDAERLTYDFIRCHYEKIPDGLWGLFAIDDDFDMAEDGTYGSLKKVENEYIKILESIKAEQSRTNRSTECR